MQTSDDRPSLPELAHQGHLARRRDILHRLEGVETLTDALETHWVSIASAQESEAKSFRPVLGSWRQTRGKRVLLVDDDQDLTTIMARMLAACGLPSDVANGGEEGLARARATAYDLMIVDLNMPDIPGMIVAEEIRRMRPDVPILIVSGVADQAELNAVVIECGATAALAKPFERPAFEEAVRGLLASSRGPGDVTIDETGAATH